MDGGLNRVNLMRAIWNADVTNPLSLDGSTIKTDGVNDAYLSRRLASPSTSRRRRRAAPGKYEFLGELINSEGKTGSVSDPK